MLVFIRGSIVLELFQFSTPRTFGLVKSLEFSVLRHSRSLGFEKILGIGAGSTYMVVRVSDIRSKIGKKFIFCAFILFLSLCHNHISWATSMPFASINLTNPRTKDKFLKKDIPMKISQSFLDSKNGSKFWWLLWSV